MDEENFINPANLKISQLMPKRPITGDMISVVVWRLIRLVGLHQVLKEETPLVTYLLGKNIGKMLEMKTVEDLKAKLVELKIGIIDIPVVDENKVHISIGECMTCAGITPPIGHAICQLEAGIIAGAMETIYPGRRVTAEETKCIGGLGDEVCLVECSLI